MLCSDERRCGVFMPTLEKSIPSVAIGVLSCQREFMTTYKFVVVDLANRQWIVLPSECAQGTDYTHHNTH
jgi:hypothetical protein